MFARLSFTSVKAKLLVAFLAMGLIPMAAVGLLGNNRATHALQDDAGLALGQVSFNVADKIDRNYFERYGDVQAFTLAASRIRDWRRIRSLMDEYMVAYGFYDLMVVADASGRIVAVNGVDQTGKPLATEFLYGLSVKGEDWFDKGIAGGIKPGETLTDRPARDEWVTKLFGDEEIVTTFTAAIRDDAGRPIGVWRNFASLQRIADATMDDARRAYKESTGSDIVFTLVDNQGVKLHDDISEEGELTRNLVTEGWESAKGAAAHDVGYVVQRDGDTGVEYIAGFGASPQALMPKYGWGVVARVDVQQALAPVVALRNTMLGIGVAAVVLLIVAGLWVSGSIARPIAQTASTMRAIARDGDLTKRLDVQSKDELGELASSFNAFVVRLGEIVQGINGASASVATASRELSSVADDISTAAQSQASSLEQTAASMEEITATVKQNAENASQASRLATTAREVADKGGRVVGEAVGAMAEINKSSRKIAEIITTIDEIAFQTNLLALNAAVEAARAGAQGRGFAVVAAEVRSLAARSASAAKEIKALIQESSAKVDYGSQLVNQSGQTLEEIVTSVKRVTDIVGEIAAASREQSVGIEEVNRAVTQMDQVTQQNAAQNEELSATAGALSGQARELDSLISWFKLEHAAATSGSALDSAPSPRSGRGMKRRGGAGAAQEQRESPALSGAASDLDGFVDF